MSNSWADLTVGAALFSLTLPAAPTAAHVSHCDSIEAARQADVGSQVDLVGTVTVPSGAFDGGFAIQQGSAGIYIVDSGGAEYVIGDRVRVEGVLVNANNLLVVQPSSSARLGRGTTIHAQRRTSGGVGEATEGKLLELRGALVGDPVDDSPYGYKLTLDDGSGPIQVFLYPGSGIAPVGLTAGLEVAVVCFSNQYDVQYECDPRVPSDITVVTPRH